VTDEVSQESGISYEFNKRYAVILLFAIIALVHLPALISRSLWMENGLIKNDFVVFIFLPVILIYLMFLCSMIFPRISPQLAAFDRIWFRWTRSELISLTLLVLGTVLVVIIVKGLRHLLPSGLKTNFFLPWNIPTIPLLIWILILIVFLSPIAEEIFWRGYVQSTLTKIVHPWFAIIGQAILFGLFHLFSPISGMMKACLLGLLFGIWCYKRRTLLPVIIMHIAINSVAIVSTIGWSNCQKFIQILFQRG
jgi:membrane protease YdiL (CAAX protease family)